MTRTGHPRRSPAGVIRAAPPGGPHDCREMPHEYGDEHTYVYCHVKRWQLRVCTHFAVNTFTKRPRRRPECGSSFSGVVFAGHCWSVCRRGGIRQQYVAYGCASISLFWGDARVVYTSRRICGFLAIRKKNRSTGCSKRNAAQPLHILYYHPGKPFTRKLQQL